MKVITPALPSTNSTYNIFDSTLDILREEIMRARDQIHCIVAGSEPWDVLFQPHQFFKIYDTFIEVVAVAATSKHHESWHGLVESRIRFLGQYLEECEGVSRVQPCTESFVAAS